MASRTCSTWPARPTAARSACWPTRRRRPIARRWRVARGRRGAGRAHQHERVRLLRRGHQPAPRHAGQRRHRGARRHAAHPRRLDLRRRGFGGRRRRLGGAGLRHRRLDPHPGRAAGLVGFKSTARLVPTDGAIPLSTTLDTVCAITTNGARCGLRARSAGGAASRAAPAPLAALRLGVPTTLMLDGWSRPWPRRSSARARHALRDAGARIERSRCRSSAELAALNAAGGFSAAESWAWHRSAAGDQGRPVRPRVAVRIRRGEDERGRLHRAHLGAARLDRAHRSGGIAGFDAMLSPTVPSSPAIALLVASDEAFFATNARCCANQRGQLPRRLRALAALPRRGRTAGRPDGVGLRCDDDRVLDASLAIETALAPARRSQENAWLHAHRRHRRRHRRRHHRHELAAAGHEVTVFERRGASPRDQLRQCRRGGARATSRPGAPGMPWKVLRHVHRRRAGAPAAPPSTWPCSAGCGAGAARLPHRGWQANRHARMQRLAVFSQPPAARADQALQLEYEHARGCLVLLRSESDLGAQARLG